MYCLVVFGEITHICCLVVILPAWVFLAFVQCSLCSCLLVTFPAWVLLSYVYYLVVSGEMTPCSCLVTPCMGISYLHVCLVVMGEITLFSCMVVKFPACVFLSFL